VNRKRKAGGSLVVVMAVLNRSLIETHLLGGVLKVAMAEVNSSGAEPPAAMKVAPATSSSTPRPL
jgi:hypothetical protein